MLMLLANLIPILMSASVITLGVTCGFGVYVTKWVRNANDNSAALDNIQLTQKQAKKAERNEKSSKFNALMIMIMLGVFCAVLIYTGITMLLV